MSRSSWRVVALKTSAAGNKPLRRADELSPVHARPLFEPGFSRRGLWVSKAANHLCKSRTNRAAGDTGIAWSICAAGSVPEAHGVRAVCATTQGAWCHAAGPFMWHFVLKETQVQRAEFLF
jgi:hypothetical protein